MEIIWLIIVGLIVGALGRLVNPGRDPMGWLLTLAIGVGSVLIVGLLLDGIGFWGYVLAVIIAAVLVTVVGRLMSGERRVTACRSPGPGTEGGAAGVTAPALPRSGIARGVPGAHDRAGSAARP
jgi:uncharacterized membrane protein YeaQ/YmgE (transglycosylase-associated protein family)